MIIGFDGGITQDTDPDQLRLVFDSKSTAFQHPKGYSNPQVDQLVAQQAVTLDIGERKKILAQLQPIVATASSTARCSTSGATAGTPSPRQSATS